MKLPLIPFSIIGKRWHLRVLTQKQYDRKKIRKGSVAITYQYKRRIDLSPKGLDLESIIHELVHAYLTEMCVYSASLGADELEEFFAELMSRRGRELLDLADVLYKKVEGLTNEV